MTTQNLATVLILVSCLGLGWIGGRMVFQEDQPPGAEAFKKRSVGNRVAPATEPGVNLESLFLGDPLTPGKMHALEEIPVSRLPDALAKLQHFPMPDAWRNLRSEALWRRWLLTNESAALSHAAAQPENEIATTSEILLPLMAERGWESLMQTWARLSHVTWDGTESIDKAVSSPLQVGFTLGLAVLVERDSERVFALIEASRRQWNCPKAHQAKLAQALAASDQERTLKLIKKSVWQDQTTVVLSLVQKLNPAAYRSFILENEGSAYVASFALTHEPSELLEDKLNGHIKKGNDYGARFTFEQWAKQDRFKALDWLCRLPQDQMNPNYAKQIFAHWPENDWAGAMKLREQFQSAPLREAAMRFFLPAMARQYMDQAVEWINSLPAGERPTAADCIRWKLITERPDIANQWIVAGRKQDPPEEIYQLYRRPKSQTVDPAMARFPILDDPTATQIWLDKFTDPDLRDEVRQGAMLALAGRNPALAQGLINLTQNPEKERAYLNEIVVSLGDHQPHRLRAFLDALPPAEVSLIMTQQLNEANKMDWSGAQYGMSGEAFLPLLDLLPAVDKGSLIKPVDRAAEVKFKEGTEAALQWLAESADRPWIRRATEDIGYQWISANPQEAEPWIVNLPDQSVRDQLLGNLASHFAGTDISKAVQTLLLIKSDEIRQIWVSNMGNASLQEKVKTALTKKGKP